MWEKYILDLCDKSFFYENIENYNMPFLDALSRYDDRRDLADYDFNQDGFKSPQDEENKRKLAYRHQVIANKYMQVLLNIVICSCFSDVCAVTVVCHCSTPRIGLSQCWLALTGCIQSSNFP